MNARTFVSNVEGDVQRIEITELETSLGREVRIMFEDGRMDDVRISLSKDGRVHIRFFAKGGKPVAYVVGHHSIGWDRRE